MKFCIEKCTKMRKVSFVMIVSLGVCHGYDLLTIKCQSSILNEFHAPFYSLQKWNIIIE